MTHADSKFNHAMCDADWTKRHPDRLPYRLIEPDEETCCYCGKPTRSGIYAREDPAAVPLHNGGVIEEWDAP